ncbi:MAG: extracellular solute-binding protein [Chloroflexota bacterium]
MTKPNLFTVRWLISALVIMSFVLSACAAPAGDAGSGGNTAASESSDSGDSGGEAMADVDMEELPYGLMSGKPYDGTELTFLICCPAAAQFAVWADSAAEFTELTGISVNFTNDPLGGLREKIVTESLGNPGSWDVTIYFDTWGPSLAGFLDPIDSFMDVDVSDYPPATIDIATLDDTLYGVPVRSHVMMFYYRQDVLDELGIAPPTTFEEVTAAAEAISAADNGMEGITMNWAKQGGGISLIPWTNVLRAGGADMFDADFRPTFNSDAAIAATEWYANLLNYAPAAAPTYNEGDARTSYASGEAAMVFAWSWAYEIFQKPDASIEEVIANTGYTANFPDGGGGSAPVAMAWPTGISTSSKNKEAAVEWIKWMTNPDMDLQAISVKDDPSRATVVANRLSSLSSEAANAPEANNGFSQAMHDAYSSATALPVYLEFPEVSEILESALSEIAAGADVAETLNAAAEEVDQIMQDSGRY